MKSVKAALLFISFLFLSCGDDDNVSCVHCDSVLTSEFLLCKEANGNASVNGEDTGVGYSVYLQGLLDEGTNCN